MAAASVRRRARRRGRGGGCGGVFGEEEGVSVSSLEGTRRRTWRWHRWRGRGGGQGGGFGEEILHIIRNKIDILLPTIVMYLRHKIHLIN